MSWLSDVWYRTKAVLKGPLLARRNARANRLHATASERFLVARHPGKKPHFYDVVLEWLAAKQPAVRARFELQQISGGRLDWPAYVLHVPWLQDPVQAWSPTAYQQANRLADECDARGIPIINRVDRLANAGKDAGSRTIARAGIRTARMARISDPEQFRETLGGLALPLFVREDWAHDGPVLRAETSEEARRIPLGKFRRPVAVEFIDVQNRRDGLFRKYRYLAAGEIGFPLSMHVRSTWFVKGTHNEHSDALREEEMDFLAQPDPNHRRLQAARKLLGLDFVAFDYSYDHAGTLVVWEANPFPHIHFGAQRVYRNPAVERGLAAMTRLYLRSAKLSVPDEIEALLHTALPARARAA